MKTKWILAGLILPAAVFAQSEQWLAYHTSNTSRSYHSIKLTTNAPPGIELPKLKATPWFGRWKTPMDITGGRWICFDRTRQSGPYNLLFIDRNGNGRLDDEKPVTARLDSYNAYFPATPVIFKTADGPVTYHLSFRFYQYGKGPARLLISSACWYEGEVKFGGVKKHIQLIDGNVNGTFNDQAANPYESDRIKIAGDPVGERFLGRMLEVDGKLFDIQVSRDGSFIKVQKAGNVTFGPVHVPENISKFAAYGKNGYFVRHPEKGELTLPIGQYRMVRWEIKRKDDNGVPWTLSGYNFPKTANFEVATNDAVSLDIGEPVKADLSMKSRGRKLTFSLKFVGKQKESIEMLRDNQRPRGPKLKLANADGSLCYTNSFEYG